MNDPATPLPCEIAQKHVERVRVAVLGRHSMATLARWVTENTTLGGDSYSYLDHEYQEAILSDTSQEVIVQKCSQVGVSEASARLALAMVNVINPMTVIYTLPTAHFAATFMKTRIDPVIAGSKAMREAVHKTNDNSEIKRFGDSFLYVKGAASSNAPISIPADVIISDETDFSDQEVLSQYTSRLTHSKWKIIRMFSTPTLPGYGVNKAFVDSRRHYNMCKCHHCGHWFVPSYYEHVKIPDYTGDLRDVRKSLLARLRWQEAQLHCPKCGDVPSLQVEHRKWVAENASENFVAAGYQISPFDAPNIIAPSYLIKVSTNYNRVQDFVNFGLGLPMEDSEATLMRSDFVNLFCDAVGGSNTVYVMGVDVGNVYHFVVAAIDGFGDSLVVHKEQVPMGEAKKRYMDLRRQYRVVCTVMDSGPHGETVMALQEQDPNMYAAVYMRSKGIATHNVVDKEAVKEEGAEFQRQINVNRSRAFDAYMNYIRENHMAIRRQGDEIDELFISQHVSMKRVKVFDSESEEMSFSWQKTDGEDHFHHAGLYCYLAGKIRGVSRSLVVLPTTGVSKFRLKQRESVS